MKISPDLHMNRNQIETLFENCQDLSIVPWQYGPEMKYMSFSVYFESLIEELKLNYMKATLQDLVTHEVGKATMITPEEVIEFFSKNGISAQSAKMVENLEDAVDAIVSGNIVIFFDEWDRALNYSANLIETRQVNEPLAESVVHGPRESTVENLNKNIGMIRLRLKTPRFKIERIAAGIEAKTEIAFGYLDRAVNPETLAEFKKRISTIHQAEVLETSYIEDWIEDSNFSPFPQYRYTERPDVAAAALLDGKIIVMVQGTGSVMLCPGLFVEMMQSAEDYYQRTMIASLIRITRIFAFFIALTLPSIYIALSTFHPELIPTVLLLAILDSREGIPFPAFVEALIMEFFFEMLREAGVRLPKPIGSAVSIVGTLVIGEAAITAGIASPIMVVVVALTGIASFSIPQYNMASALRLLRFPLMIMAASLGGFGLMVGCIWILLHLACLRSLGQPYLGSLAPVNMKYLRDVFVRAPLRTFLRSPRNRHKQN
ncbi:spore germination protein [Paenibacillus arenilitoris]|uniref:Spore germination protein n=1 Tax=Paenibacillus arenilitoris TaxID=2772299 RepID=A0A927CWR1_9BACL|nr:spore germination protein [Paenibacillus arenilitoris]MBD2872935.1 spore germination protein [Paenibacillus arenilitoris]